MALNLCNVICRFHSEDSEIVAICFNIKNKSLIIQDNKNERWIKEGKNESFSDWVKSDKCVYETYINIPFYGDINNSLCSVIKECGDSYFKKTFEHNSSSERILCAFITENDYSIFFIEHSKFRWKKYIIKESGLFFETFPEAFNWFQNQSSEILNLESFILKYPCKYTITPNKPIKQYF
jgi:hypothetical protein